MSTIFMKNVFDKFENDSDKKFYRRRSIKNISEEVKNATGLYLKAYGREKGMYFDVKSKSYMTIDTGLFSSDNVSSNKEQALSQAIEILKKYCWWGFIMNTLETNDGNMLMVKFLPWKPKKK